MTTQDLIDAGFCDDLFECFQQYPLEFFADYSPPLGRPCSPARRRGGCRGRAPVSGGGASGVRSHGGRGTCWAGGLA